MRILLTGGTGFVGSHLTRGLIAVGHDVHLVVRNTSKLDLLGDGAGRAVIHQYQGGMSEMASILQVAEPKIVIHLASLFLAQHSPKDITDLIESNVLFGTHLLEAMARYDVHHLINVGTSWQHYQDAEYDPVCLYAATKQAFHDIVIYYARSQGFRVVTLKLFDTYGRNDPRPKIVSLLRDLAKGKTAALDMSGGDQLIDLVQIDDVVRAFLRAIELVLALPAGSISDYAVTSGAPVPLRQLAAVFEAVSGTQLPIRWGARPYRPREVMRPWSRGIPVPGWNPSVPLQVGIRELMGDDR